jgi:hypothetical protein
VTTRWFVSLMTGRGVELMFRRNSRRPRPIEPAPPPRLPGNAFAVPRDPEEFRATLPAVPAWRGDP